VAGFDGNGTVHGSHLKPATGQILTVCVAQGPVQGQFPMAQRPSGRAQAHLPGGGGRDGQHRALNTTCVSVKRFVMPEKSPTMIYCITLPM